MKINRLALRLCMCALVLFRALSLYADGKDSLSRKMIHMAGIDAKPAYVFPTHEFFAGNNATFSPIRKNLSVHLKYGFKFAPDTYFGQMYPHAVQGIGVGYNTFFHSSELGNPWSVYAFQTSRIASLTSRLSLDYEWNFGASFGWKKYDAESNPYNRVVGSKINAYIHLGFLLNWQLDAQTNLRAGVGVTHFSNGNTAYPNAGVNTLGASIGLTRYFGGASRAALSDGSSCIVRRPPFKPYVSYDLVVYGATRKKGVFPADGTPVLVPGSFGILGLNFTPMYNFSRYFRAGVSVDAQYDESANISGYIANSVGQPDAETIKFYRPPFREQFAVGLSVRAEVVMPIFSINLGIGRNVICKGADTDSFYQILALKTDITKNLFLHVGYQLHDFKDPNNLMLGVGFRFNAKGRE